MKQYRWITRLIAIVIVFCLPALAFAQTDPGDCPTCVPIDGGLGFLIAAGVGYGVKKVRDSRKKQA